jgi:hypothetical protein
MPKGGTECGILSPPKPKK